MEHMYMGLNTWVVTCAGASDSDDAWPQNILVTVADHRATSGFELI